MTEEKMGFGFQSDQDESLKGKSGYGVFGLNTGTISKFEYSPAGKDENEREFNENIAIEIAIGDATMKQWWYPVNKVFGKNGEITDTTSEEYIRNYNEQMKQFKAVMTHYLKIFNSEEELKVAFNTPMATYADFAKQVCKLMQPAIIKSLPIDLFLQYQWTLKPGNTQTFLEMPKNLKDGSFVTAYIKPVGSWKEVRDADGLKYVDDAGNEHRFKRSKSYLETPKAIQQKEDDSKAGTAMNTGSGASAAKSAW